MMRSSERFCAEGARARTWGAECAIVNASSTGMFLASKSPPPIGQSLNLELALADDRPMSVTARVVWINDSGRPGAQHLPPGFGVCIQRIGLTEKLALIKFLRGQRPAAAAGVAKGDDSARAQ
jgi:Tfp pilus assembly protein PilZ